MTKAIWNGVTLAESDDVLLVEFAVYFPREAVAQNLLRESAAAATYCHWKGVAKYYDVIVDNDVNEGAAWTYPDTYDEANGLRDHFAFWKGIEIVDKPDGDVMKDPGGPLGSRTGYEALCWLMVRTEETSLSQGAIADAIGLDRPSLEAAFANDRTQPFAKHYKWSLVDGALVKG